MPFTKYEERGAYHWQELADRSVGGYAARLRAFYSFFLDEAGKRGPDVVIDVGCGDAALTHLIAERTGASVTGIEPEPEGIEMARTALAAAGSRAEVIQARGEDLPFGDDSAALVVMCEVVEHIDPIEPVLREAARVLRPGGALLVSTPQWQTPELREHHVREFTATELRTTLEECVGAAEVLVSEPPRLYDAYMRGGAVTAGVNLLARAGLNPFAVRRPGTPRRARWRELFAVATR